MSAVLDRWLPDDDLGEGGREPSLLVDAFDSVRGNSELALGFWAVFRRRVLYVGFSEILTTGKRLPLVLPQKIYLLSSR